MQSPSLSETPTADEEFLFLPSLSLFYSSAVNIIKVLKKVEQNEREKM